MESLFFFFFTIAQGAVGGSNSVRIQAHRPGKRCPGLAGKLHPPDIEKPKRPLREQQFSRAPADDAERKEEGEEEEEPLAPRALAPPLLSLSLPPSLLRIRPTDRREARTSRACVIVPFPPRYDTTAEFSTDSLFSPLIRGSFRRGRMRAAQIPWHFDLFSYPKGNAAFFFCRGSGYLCIRVVAFNGGVGA